jgi:DNA polymerase III epsilon subunit-like protein
MNYLAIDTETGGLDSSECALLSVALVPSWDAPPLNLCILPEGRIEAKAAEVNGYTPELWAERGAVSEKMAAFEMLNWLHHAAVTKYEYHLVAHNAGFDALFLLAWQHRVGIDFELPGIWHCTKIMLQKLRLPAGSHNLDTLGTLSGFWEAEKRLAKHDALQDARCALHGFHWLLEKRKGAAHE